MDREDLMVRSRFVACMALSYRYPGLSGAPDWFGYTSVGRRYVWNMGHWSHELMVHEARYRYATPLKR
jgi:hypothetical protein